MARQRRRAHHRRQGHGPGVQRLRRPHAGPAHRPPRHRPHPLLDHRLEHLAQRPAGVPQRRRPPVRPRPQRQPRQHRAAGRRARRCCPGTVTSDSDLVAELLGGRAARRARRGRATADAPRAGARPRCCPGSRAPSRSCSWTPTASSACATPTASGRSASAGSTTAGCSPRRRPALDIVGAHFVREVEPGEMVVIDARRRPLAAAVPRRAASTRRCACSSSSTSPGPTARLYGQSVHHARVRLGELLAEQARCPGRRPRPTW